MFDVANMLKNLLEKCPNKYLLAFKHAGLVIWSLGAPRQHPKSSGKLLALAIPQISTRVSSYSHVMLLDP